jgi:hypothetical protein
MWHGEPKNDAWREAHLHTFKAEAIASGCAVTPAVIVSRQTRRHCLSLKFQGVDWRSPSPQLRAMLSAMREKTSVLERAFQLAESGEYSTVTDIKRRLTDEGYSTTQVTGGHLSRQLMALCKTARGK